MWATAAEVVEREKDISRLKRLASTKITSVSKKPEDPFTAAASVYVITQEDIKRSGATTVAEALRLVPGMEVARAGSNWWAISARGFNDNTSNKLLVMIDGRTVYNAFFSGVWWDSQDVLMEDIRRIEVIRGPGATLWGANAVNGVVNIITEDAGNTIGKQVTATYGNAEKIVTGRVGGNLSDNAQYRLYAKDSARDSFKSVNGTDARDSWDIGQTGFRVDWDKTDHDLITIQGDAYNSNIDRTASLPILTAPYSAPFVDNSNVFGGNVLSRWTHTSYDSSVSTLQSYVDHTERDFVVSREIRSTFDFDFQRALHPMGRHEFTLGTGYRFVRDEEPFAFYFPVTPTITNLNLFSGFLQDKIAIIPDKLSFTIGSKVEHNDDTGFEYEPSARIAWTPTYEQTIWGAVSRAIRSPSSYETRIQQIVGAIPPNGLYTGSPAGYVRLIGNPNMGSEDLLAYELGYRVRPSKVISFDISTFVNQYDNLRTFDTGTPFSTSSDTALPLIIHNYGKAESYGAEFSSKWDATEKWQLSGGYTFLIMTTHINSGSTDTTLAIDEKKSPEHQFNIRSHYNLPYDVALDNTLYYVGALDTINVSSYVRFDTGITYKPIKGLELSLVGQNLFDDAHKEFAAIPVLPTVDIGRSVYGKVSWSF
jgi:iron complex outermembrane receptor protein